MATTTHTPARHMTITLDVPLAEAWALRSGCQALGLACTIESKGLIFKRHEATIHAADIDTLSYRARLFLIELTKVALAQMGA